LLTSINWRRINSIDLFCTTCFNKSSTNPKSTANQEHVVQQVHWKSKA